MTKSIEDFYRGIGPREAQARCQTERIKKEDLKKIMDYYYSELQTAGVAAAAAKAAAAGLDEEDAVNLYVVMLFFFRPLFIIVAPLSLPDHASFVSVAERKERLATILSRSIAERNFAADILIDQVKALWLKYDQFQIAKTERKPGMIGCVEPDFLRIKMKKRGVI